MASVLLVEDNDDVREMMALALQLAGHDVLLARNGRDALGKLKARPRPCVILLDLMMPVMNGWEFREALRDEPALRDVPVVVVSALNKEMAEDAGVSAYLPKPVDIDRMLELVAEHCDGDHCTTESLPVSHP
jgi:CheY-like chemotaxis protein